MIPGVLLHSAGDRSSSAPAVPRPPRSGSDVAPVPVAPVAPSDARGLPDDLQLSSPRSVLGSRRLDLPCALPDSREDEKGEDGHEGRGWEGGAPPPLALMRRHTFMAALSTKTPSRGDISFYLYLLLIK